MNDAETFQKISETLKRANDRALSGANVKTVIVVTVVQKQGRQELSVDWGGQFNSAELIGHLHRAISQIDHRFMAEEAKIAETEEEP